MPKSFTSPDTARAGTDALSPRIILVLGGARSGKSALAEQLAFADGRAHYVATAQAFDSEMVARIELHRDRRGPGWSTTEEPLDLVGTIGRLASPKVPILVDCLTLWTSNLMFAERDMEAEGDALAHSLKGLPGRVIFVANEVGLGIVPDNALARRFRDAAGRLNQKIAAVADRVLFVAAGLPLVLKG